MQPAHYSSLLPELFRHKNSRVRIFQPQVILLDFHGTLSERRWEDKVIYPYVKRSVGSFLKENWNTEVVRRCIPGLRNESFEQRFRHKYEDAPIIDDTGSDDIEPMQLVDQLTEFLNWQMATKKETRETQILERLIWIDGFKKKHILTPIYEDVMTCIKSWRESHNCSIHIISSVDSDTLKLLFENTDKGNLSQYISGYVTSKKTGSKFISETYKQFHEKLEKPKSAHQPVLFLTDSGQEAKAASSVADGSAFECILVNRPGNKRIRTYYLSQFQYIDKFEDIEFVSR